MLRLLRTKGCKRCGGDLSLERDEYGAYIECIQCGAVWNQVEPVRQPEPVGVRHAVALAKTTASR